MGNYLNSTYWHINFFFAVGSCLESMLPTWGHHDIQA